MVFKCLFQLEHLCDTMKSDNTQWRCSSIAKTGPFSDSCIYNEEINNLKPFAAGRSPTDLRAKSIKCTLSGKLKKHRFN